ncbi:MAG TPA: HAMP domain-containing sensor histidine kinase, partial [Thermoanaerobaculia bacterium]|nr:HAMP domain-containing sensor histidine kinase [Thermoanaerobaculia bacterium]
DREFVDEALKLPARAAMCGLVVSVLAFNVAAFVLRRSIAIPPIEAAKIASLGLVIGTLLSVLSYFALLPAVRTLIDEAIERGAVGPEKPTFPIRKKVLACSLAIAAIMAGLFGLQALAQAQRYVEERAMVEGRLLVASMAAEARARLPQSREAWRALLSTKKRPAGAVTFAIGPGGSLLLTEPEEPPAVEDFLLKTSFFSAGEAAPKEGAFVTRWGDVRAVARESVSGFASVGVILRPDPAVLRGVLTSFLVVGLEALFAALLLAFTAGIGITGPIARLSNNLERFAAAPGSASATPVVTDDEIARLAVSFEVMQSAVREAQERVADLSRRAERETLLARVAHEVRNPLFGIQSTLSALELQLGPSAPPEYFTVLKAEAARLSRLVDEMLAGETRPEAEGTRLASTLEEAEALVRARVPDRPLTIRRTGPMDDIEVPLDRERAIVLLADLFESVARRATKRAELELEFSRADGEAIVTSRDQGPMPGSDDGPLSSCRKVLEGAGGHLEVRAEASRTVTELRFPKATQTP